MEKRSFLDTKAESGKTYEYYVSYVEDVEYSPNMVSSRSEPITIKYIAAPKITSLTAGNSGIEIKWAKVNGAEKYRVYRKTSNTGWKGIGDTTALSYTDGTALLGTEYTYTVRCISGNGKTSTSGYDHEGRTIRYAAAPTLRTIGLAVSGVKLTWGSSSGATKYRVFRKTNNNDWIKLADTSELSFIDRQAVSGTTYTYTVRCTSDDGKSCTSGFDRTGKTITYIAAPTITGVSSVNDGVKVGWGKVPGAANYRVYRKTEGTSWKGIGDTTALNYTDTTAMSGTTYTYTVRCMSSDGKYSTSSYDNIGRTITYIAAPEITGVSNVNGGIQVKWGKVTGAEKYRVFRKTPDTGWKPIGDTTALDYMDETAISGMTYTYTVRCITDDGKSCTSDYDRTGKTVICIATPTITEISNIYEGVKVKWGKVTGAEKYRVYRKTGGTSWKGIGDTTALNYTDTTAVGGTEYTYTVRCITSDGKSSTSSYDNIGRTITYIAAPEITGVSNVNGGVEIKWGKVTGAEKYRVYRRTEGTVWQSIGDTTALNYTDATAVSGTTYTYTVRCITSDGKSSMSSYDSIGKTITYAAAPVLKTVSPAVGGINVTWNESSGAVTYRIYRKCGSGTWAEIKRQCAGTSYLDQSVVSGTAYTYTVRCEDENGNLISGFDGIGKTATAR